MLGKNQRNGFEKWQNDEFSKEPSSKGTTNRFVEENNFFFFYSNILFLLLIVVCILTNSVMTYYYNSYLRPTGQSKSVCGD